MLSASAVVLWVLLFRGCMAVCDVKPVPVWTTGPGQTVPPTDFRFIGFPISGAAPLYDANGNVLSGPLRRAAAIPAGVADNGWLTISGGAMVKRADLTLVPPADWEAELEAYSKMREANDKEFLGAKIKSDDLGAGLLRIKFEEILSDWTVESTYLVRTGRGEPEELRYRDWGDFVAMLKRAVIAVPVAVALGGIGTKLLRRAFLGKKVRSVALEKLPE